MLCVALQNILRLGKNHLLRFCFRYSRSARKVSSKCHRIRNDNISIMHSVEHISERVFQLKFIWFFRAAIKVNRIDLLLFRCQRYADFCAAVEAEMAHAAAISIMRKSFYLHTWWKLTKLRIRVLIAFLLAQCTWPLREDWPPKNDSVLILTSFN